MCLTSSCEWPNFTIKDLPSVLIIIISDQILNDSLCCLNKYNWCLCRFIGKLYILLWTLLEILSVISIFVHEVFWIKLIVGVNNYEIRPWSVSLLFFSVRLFSVLRGHLVFSSSPQRPMTSNFKGFLYQILSITLFSYLNSWERASISLFNVEC